MRCRLDLSEDSPNTIEGSFTKDLIFSKFWLCSLIISSMEKSGKTRFKDVYVLGSWFGNMFLILREHNIGFERMILVDKDPACIDASKKLLANVDGRLRFFAMDANDVSYKAPGTDILVINTSCNDMQDGDKWFRMIPEGSMVALQSRDDVESIADMDKRFPLKRVDFVGSRSFSDPEKDYQRLSKVGIK